MSRRTRALKLTLIGPSLLAASCGGGAAPAPPAGGGAPAAAELGPNEERALAAALAGNAVGNAGIGPLPALPVAAYAFASSEAPRAAGATRRYPSSTHRRSTTYIAPYYWTTSRYHAPSVYQPGRASFATARPATSRPATTRVGGFGTTGRSVST